MSTAYIGEIRPFAGSVAPEGWALCDGSGFSSQKYPVLALLIGVSFDEAGRFRLPDLRGRVPIHRGQGLAIGASNHPFGSKGGSESVTLIPAEAPQHTHRVLASVKDADTASPAGAILARPISRNANVIKGYLYIPGAEHQSVALDASAISIAGASQPHENCMPSLAISYIICLQGMDPRT